jgi:hypothetical protein
MKKSEKGAATNSRYLPAQSRVFADFLQRNFFYRRQRPGQRVKEPQPKKQRR